MVGYINNLPFPCLFFKQKQKSSFDFVCLLCLLEFTCQWYVKEDSRYHLEFAIVSSFMVVGWDIDKQANLTVDISE
jgi:hypothetical protein